MGDILGDALSRVPDSSVLFALPCLPQITSIPPRAGTFMGSITFRTPDGQMVWYAVEVRASEASVVDTIQVSAQVRFEEHKIRAGWPCCSTVLHCSHHRSRILVI